MALPYVTREQLKKSGGGGGGGASTTLLAPEWMPQHNYIVGDVVAYRNNLYACTQDHESEDNFSDQYWESTTVFDSVIGLLNTEL